MKAEARTLGFFHVTLEQDGDVPIRDYAATLKRKPFVVVVHFRSPDAMRKAAHDRVHGRTGDLARRLRPIHGNGMARALKTTVYLDEDDYERIKEIARAEERAPAELVREAVAEYAAPKRPRRKPRSIGIGRSRKGDVSERAEELLAGFGRQR